MSFSDVSDALPLLLVQGSEVLHSLTQVPLSVVPKIQTDDELKSAVFSLHLSL